MTIIHYAFQACDTKSNQNEERYCGDDRTLLSMKSLTSFLQSVKNVSECENGKNSKQYVMIFADNCSEQYLDYMYKCINHFSSLSVDIDIKRHDGPSSLMRTVRDCWEWLESEGKDIVYQVQDDYIFFPTALEEMITIIFQVMNDCKGHNPIVVPYNNPYLWLATYRYTSIPMTMFPSKSRYWVQCYDVPCTFMTTKPQFSAHWDIYEKFLNLPSTYPRLEPETLNRIMVDRKVLGLQPVTSVALHMQAETEKDPFIDWKSLWDSINLV